MLKNTVGLREGISLKRGPLLKAGIQTSLEKVWLHLLDGGEVSRVTIGQSWSMIPRPRLPDRKIQAETGTLEGENHCGFCILLFATHCSSQLRVGVLESEGEAPPSCSFTP